MYAFEILIFLMLKSFSMFSKDSEKFIRNEVIFLVNGLSRTQEGKKTAMFDRNIFGGYDIQHKNAPLPNILSDLLSFSIFFQVETLVLTIVLTNKLR